MIRVLHVDDDRLDLQLIKAQLTRLSEDIEIESVESPEKAFKCLQNKDYEAIVSDYHMPGMDGLAFLKTVKKMGNKTPFYFLSSNEDRAQIQECLLNGAEDFYHKSSIITKYKPLLCSVFRSVYVRKLLKDNHRLKTQVLKRMHFLSKD